ncbi:hypothetical protein PN467_03485 [Microcystis aeruginosa CS-563/04]|jgi:hypothetical protein|uniref:Uncharacterized protein n=1 Tax=Microcystis aeruginosa FD4 TaxID=2686288 RepID=A0A857D9M4_MICAE|nr:hypothetical protein [Microcystis aeruginosa CS-563/04]QGZ91860.1 hypothetical protein GQR42_22425 [Microcystis aeruginosa FD4]
MDSIATIGIGITATTDSLPFLEMGGLLPLVLGQDWQALTLELQVAIAERN